MKHGLCVRGIAAASLAFAVTTASAASPVAAYANALPVASPARLSAGPVADGTVIDSPQETAAPGDPVDQQLGELVQDHAAAVVIDEERGCLARAVYFEARGESLEGQLAVAEVVLNRAASGEYPALICEVVKQPAQFSFVRDGLFPPIDEDSASWRRAVAIAHIAVDKLAEQLPADVLWYHADHVTPAWGGRLARSTQIGAHIFYRRG